MTATAAPPVETSLQDPEALTLRLEAVAGRLVDLSRQGPGRKIAEPLMACVQELRQVWSALRSLALAFDANRAETTLEHERELRQAMEILNGTVDSLSRSNERTVATVDRQLDQLDQLDSVGDAGVLVSRLRDVTGSVREAATEMKDDIVRSAADLSVGEQIISAVDRKLTEARQQVLRDSLTRVLSRVAFEQRLGELAAQASTVTGAWCVALADIDRLSAINERHGRRVGDALLVRVAAIIQSTCESTPGSIVGRYGGEEFAVLLPRCSLRQGRVLAEEIRTAVAHSKWESKAGGAPAVISATLSIGVTEHRNGEEVPPLLRRAEACCEQAKRTGRDRVVAEG